MKKAVIAADRISAFSLWLVASANLVFFLLFLLTLTLAAGTVHAAAPACTGSDMIAEMKARDPARLAVIEKEAAKTVNGKGLLWKIEKEGLEPSWLFGTMHMTDPRVVTLPPAAQAAFDQASSVVIETTDVLDPAKMAAAMMQSPELMMFTDKTTLMSLLPPEDLELVEKALSQRGIPLESVAKMKPWMLSSMVALPACELARKQAGEPMLDINLANEAKADGKEIGGLETAKSQLEAMAALPMPFHVEGLVETLKLGDRIDDVIETMIGLYVRGETGMFWPFMHEALPSPKTGEAGYAEFDEKMITARNGVMAANAEPFIGRGKAFIAVGAMHLPGEQGVIERLRRDGFEVSRAD